MERFDNNYQDRKQLKEVSSFHTNVALGKSWMHFAKTQETKEMQVHPSIHNQSPRSERSATRFIFSFFVVSVLTVTGKTRPLLLLSFD